MKRLLPFIVLIVLLLGGIIAVPVLMNPERHRAEITDGLSKLVKRPVVIGPLALGYFPPTLQLGQVAIMKEAGNPVLQIQSTVALLDFPSLLHLKFVPVDLQLNQWTLTVLRMPDGRWDLSNWLSGLTAPPAGPLGALRQISWKEGQIHWVDGYGSVAQELVLGSLSGRWDQKDATISAGGDLNVPGSAAKVNLNAKGKYLGSPQWAGDIQLTDNGHAASFHLEYHADAFDIKGGAAKWSLANALAFLKFYGRGAPNRQDSLSRLSLENWQLHVSGNAGHLSFEHAAGISGGLSEAKGTIAAQGTGLLVKAEGAAKDIPAEAIWSVMGEDISLGGKVTAVATDAELVLSSRTVSTFNGQGYWELKDGLYLAPAASLKKLAKAKTMAYMKKKFPDFETKGIPVAKFSAHWQAKDGMINVDDGLFMAAGIKAGWTGRFDALRQGLDGFLRLQIREKDPRLVRLIPTQYQNQPAYGRLQGTLQDWSLRAVRITKIPSPVQAKLRAAVR